MVLIIGGILGGFGVLCCIATAVLYPKPLTNPTVQALIVQKPNAKKKQVCLLWLAQTVFVCLSLVLFHFLETQTQIDTRLAFVETGYIVSTLQQHAFKLGLFPFVIYGVLGLGLAYFSICLGEKPILARAFSLKRTGKRMTKLVLFWQNFMFVSVSVITTMPFVFVSSFALFWLCEVANAYFGLDSLFSVPLRTMFILGLLIFVFQRINKQLIAWMGKNQISVAQILIIYVLTFALLLLWLHGSVDWLTLPIAQPSFAGEKSYFAGTFSEQSLQIRMQYLIWGWWSIWIPWMTSLVARSSIGFSIPRALVHALLLPAIVFGWGMQYIGLAEWTAIYQWLQLPTLQLAILLSLFLCMWAMWGEMLTMGDVLRGAMLPIRRVSNHSLTRWMTILLFWIIGYIPSGFILGWLPMQVMVTVGGLFLNTVAALLIGIWAASVYRRWISSSLAWSSGGSRGI